jgi:hypothetical protein
MEIPLEKKVWWNYLEEDLRELFQQSIFLIKIVEKWERDPAASGHKQFHDYAFIVFPIAKAYEGFLKTLFLDLGFISEKDFFGKRFRVGSALNPALEKRYRRRESVYDQIVEFCGGRQLADILWDTWKSCRNMLFHWFPNEKNAISFKEAIVRVEKVVKSIDLAFKECKINRSS